MKRILGVFFAAAIVTFGLSAGSYGQNMHQNRNINQRAASKDALSAALEVDS